MNVHAPGSKVKLHGHTATVITVHLYPSSCVRYTLAYWKDGNRTELTVEGFEVQPHDDSFTRTIGFKS